MTVSTFIQEIPRDELYGTWVTLKVNSSGKVRGVPCRRFSHRTFKGICQKVKDQGQQLNLVVKIFGNSWARNMSFGEGTEVLFPKC